MKKLRKVLYPVLGGVAVVAVALKMLGNTGFNTLISCLYLIGGLLLLAVEITSRENRKPWIRIVLILIPVLIIPLAVQNLLTHTYSSTIVISLGMFICYQSAMCYLLRNHERNSA
jgi:hypothetical protein